MPQTTSEHPADNVCEQCRKPLPDGERKGSLTSFLFQASFCSCGRDSQKRGVSAGSLSKNVTGEEFCKRCGLRQVEAEKNGSLTGFLFFHTRCKCPPELDKTTMMSELLRSRQSLSDPLFNTLSPNSKTRGREIDLAQGAVIGSTYKIIKLIGRGGMGEVYLAQHQTLGKRCALKVILPEQLNQEAWQRFQQEAKIIANLEHLLLQL